MEIKNVYIDLPKPLLQEAFDKLLEYLDKRGEREIYNKIEIVDGQRIHMETNIKGDVTARVFFDENYPDLAVFTVTPLDDKNESQESLEHDDDDDDDDDDEGDDDDDEDDDDYDFISNFIRDDEEEEGIDDSEFASDSDDAELEMFFTPQQIRKAKRKMRDNENKLLNLIFEVEDYLDEKGFTEKKFKLEEKDDFKNPIDDYYGKYIFSRSVEQDKARRRAIKAYQDNQKAIDNEKNRTLPSMLEKIRNINEFLVKKVKGQDEAIRAFLSGYFKYELNEDKAMWNTFLFAGSPGTGKTYLANCIAKALELPILVVNMSEYSNDQDSSGRFQGLDPVWKNPKEGVVTSFVRSHPKCILVFDEIERCHVTVTNLFLQIYNEGFLTDLYTKERISFKHVIGIFTTNAGKGLYDSMQYTHLSSLPRKQIIAALLEDKGTNGALLSAPLVSRFDSGTICMFNKLEPFALIDIIKNGFAESVKTFSERFDVQCTMDNNLYPALLYSNGGLADARSSVRTAEEYVSNELNEALSRIGKDKAGEIKNIKFTIEDKELDSIFKEKGVRAVVICNNDVKKQLDHFTIKNVELCFATSLEEAKKMVLRKCTFIILDIEFNLRSTRRDFIDIEDLDSDGRDLLDFIQEFVPDLPVYFLNKGLEKYQFDTLLKYGHGLIDTSSFCEMVSQAKESSLVAYNMLQLTSASKLLKYRTRQYINGDSLVIEMYHLHLVSNYNMDSDAFVSNIQRPSIKFGDVVGATETKKVLKEYITYLNDPVGYLDRGIKPPKGLLLYGPPGTGKTLLAKAFAGESSVSFIQKNGADFINEGPESIKKLFAVARKYAPTIIFIDEVDAFAKARTGYNFTDSTLNMFLSEFEGFIVDNRKPVLVVAATNYDVKPNHSNTMRVLDAAFVRRFDKTIKVDLPNKQERIDFIKFFLDKYEVKNISEACIEEVANRTFSFSPDDLDKMIENVIRYSETGVITDKELSDAVDARNFGKENKITNPEEIEKTAVHEAGHALVCYMTGKKPAFMTIVSRGDYGGYMAYEDEEPSTCTKKELLNKITTALAGRAAEMVVYGEDKGMTTGPSSDLYQATQIAREMICSYGMYGSLLSMEHEDFDKKELSIKMDELLNQQYQEAKHLIEENRTKFDQLVLALREKNSLNKQEIDDILK